MIKKFWDWFLKNNKTLRKIREGEYDLIDDILKELRKIRKGLAVEFEDDGDKIIMTISSDGVYENFGIVKEIVDKAPKIDNWGFIAFRQPVPKEKIDDITVTVDELELDPKILKFLPITEDNNLYIQIFSEFLTDENTEQISYASLMLLDNIVGEYDCVTKVKGYEFDNLSEAAEFSEDLIPLTEIREFLDDYYREDA